VKKLTVLVTGGAGFIGRWVVKKLLNNYEVTVLDNLSNGSIENIKEFFDSPDFSFIEGDVLNSDLIEKTLKDKDLCIHAAAQINVQESLENPENSFRTNVVGTYNILEGCRKHKVKLVLIGTCMVYDTSSSKPISEGHPVKPLSPYAGSKIAAEELALSYYYGYNLPVIVLRPFNTYGPFQKTNMEGGVVSIFVRNYLEGKKLKVYGNGNQTRDLLYVEDCADFIVNASLEKKAIGEILNAGTGKDIRIKDLANIICRDKGMLEYVPHHHPQAEIQRLLCDYSKARKFIGWEPKISLKVGIERTMEWIKQGPS
jgi:dTDP-glucose 4,6-dehydratase